MNIRKLLLNSCSGNHKIRLSIKYFSQLVLLLAVTGFAYTVRNEPGTGQVPISLKDTPEFIPGQTGNSQLYNKVGELTDQTSVSLEGDGHKTCFLDELDGFGWLNNTEHDGSVEITSANGTFTAMGLDFDGP